MDPNKHRIVRVLSNNAVICEGADQQIVVVGKGVGFSRRAGDIIEGDAAQQNYVEVDSDRLNLLNWVSTLRADGLSAIAGAIDTAAETLGQLHPAVYALMLDHIAFAVQRVSQGDLIENPLAPQISALYPEELDAARQIVAKLNDDLGIELPEDEASFIALHLNAARLGSTVKQPLHRANALASAMDETLTALGRTPSAPVRAEISSALVELAARRREGRLRHNDAAAVIEQALPHDLPIARRVASHLAEGEDLPVQMRGEIAFLAIRIHGWRQDADVSTTQ